MALAKAAREQLHWAVIIFLTAHDEFAPDGYRVQALRYLSKRTIDQQLDEAQEPHGIAERQPEHLV